MSVVWAQKSWESSERRLPGYIVLIKLSVVGEYAILLSPGLVGRPQGVE
jgi:hypothetical protein